MSEILLYYKPVPPSTWVYLSSLLTIALFFKFSRLWSVRNLDLIGLILLAPGLLFVIYGREKGVELSQQTGYIWLFAVCGLFLIRMLLDPVMVRRPLLDPNLSVGGLTFLGLALLVFLMGNVIIDQTFHVNESLRSETRRGEDSQSRLDQTRPRDAAVAANDQSQVNDQANQADGPDQPDSSDNQKPASSASEPLQLYGPGYPWVFEIFHIPTRILFEGDEKALPPGTPREPITSVRISTARTVAVFSYLAIVSGMVVIGYRHFDNVKTGIAAAVLFLLLPYTAILTGRYLDVAEIHIGQVYHVLLAALLVWAIAMYKRPLVSGILLGLAIGMFYYPIFLLPLWCSFYWQRGLRRFGAGVVSMLVVLVVILYFHPSGPSFMADVRQMFGWLLPRTENLPGFWGLRNFNDSVYRLPVLVAFVAMCITLAFWPAQKNLGTLMSCSTAVMLGIQFWHVPGGGQLLGWYLPLMLLTIFRPNLEDRVAVSVLGEWTLGRRKPRLANIDQAA